METYKAMMIVMPSHATFRLDLMRRSDQSMMESQSMEVQKIGPHL